jgi:Rieske 2Fe-2S family protein
MQITREPPPNQYNGLMEHTRGLPAEAYFDPRQYERELQRIWYRNWIYVCRSTEVGQPRAYLAVEVGDQRLLLVRDDSGVLRGFHNTCRHRGAALCRETRGTLRSGAIVCPYHAWTYDLRGELQRTSSKRHGEGFVEADFSLYPVRVCEWRGFIFVALTEDTPPFETSFDSPITRLDAWPLEGLKVVHVIDKSIDCNWKLFWENFNECLHCPLVHPNLCQLVPIYGRGLIREGDDPDWRLHAADSDPKYKGGLRGGAETWSLNGQLTGVPFTGLKEADQRRGAVYVTSLPSVFIVGHLDYVRVVRLRPAGPERTRLRVEYLFSDESLAKPGFDPASVVDFTNTVMTEDAEVCGLNQRGLHAAPHVAGVVMPEEYLVRQFHEWLASELARNRKLSE